MNEKTRQVRRAEERAAIKNGKRRANANIPSVRNIKGLGLVHPLYRKPKKHLIQFPSVVDFKSGEDEDLLVERVECAKSLRVEQARSDPNAFAEYCFEDSSGTPFVQAWFHEEWHQAITDHARTIIVSPRNHGKTSQIVIRVIWELGNNPNLRIKIVCASDSKAIERLFEIAQHIESNLRVQEVFPHLKPAARGDWTKHKVVVQRRAKHRDASVEALGITSTATGGRCDLLIADDVVDRRNALQLPKMRTIIKQAWYSDWTQLLEPTGRVVYICTLWHKGDLSHDLLRNKEYHVVRYDVTEHLEALWPEVWNSVKLKQRRREIGPIEFNRGFRNIAQDISDAIIHPEWIRWFNPDDIDPNNIIFLLSYDPAYGQKSQHDYFACVVLGIDLIHNEILVFDAYHTRIPAPMQVKQIAADWKMFKPEMIVVESIAAQEGLAQTLEDRYPAMPLYRHTPITDKIQRMNATTPYLYNGMIRFSVDLKPDAMVLPERGDLISELFDFPIGANDDMCDAFSQAIKFAVQGFMIDAQAQAGQAEAFVIGD